MKPLKKIVIVVCYFGKFPWYFRYFLHSCKYNPSIDFLLVTDNCEYSYISLPNFRVVNFTFEEFKVLIKMKLNIPVTIDNPYKLCDFKPTYGHVLKDFIKGYDFWAYGDLDVIYGNIRSFITDELLSKYDVVSVRHDYLPGAFTLFRNDSKINSLFKKSKNYRKALGSKNYLGFDETSFCFKEFAENIPVEEIHSEIESMTHVVRKLQKQNQINAYFDFHVIEGLPGKLKWVGGKLTFKNKFEVLYYHLIIFKQIYSPKKEKKVIPNKFYITSNKIIHYN